MRYILLLTVFLSACSTVERHTYFSPSGEIGITEGPSLSTCGMVNFGGSPDKITHNGIRYYASQSYEPYLFGPWLLTVIPVFPITWIADAFINPNLNISYWLTSEDYSLPNNNSLKIIVDTEAGPKELKPYRIKKDDNFVTAKFPIKANKLKSFYILTEDGNSIQFEKTSRWAWTQLCANG